MTDLKGDKAMFKKLKVNRNVLLTSIGAGFEYYDFIIYGMLAGYLSELFFKSADPAVALFQTFAIFFTGYLVRPLGGVFFGLMGDRYGRKKTFIVVMLLMAASTFLIGCLPDFDQIGLLAPLLLLVLRIIQGFSFGADLPNAMTMSCEFVEEKNRAVQTGYVMSSAALGSMLASLFSYFLAAHFVKEDILSYAWRMPFLFGGLLAIIGLYLRIKLVEPDAFLKEEHKAKSLMLPLKEIFQNHLWSVIRAMGVLMIIATMIIGVIYLLSFLNMEYGYEKSDLFLANTLSLVWSALSLPLMGFISDRVGRKRLFSLMALLLIFGIWSMFGLLDLKHFTALVAFFCLYQTFISGLVVNYFPILSQLFPTEIRFTAIALSYNIVFSLAGMVPMILSYLQIFYKGSLTIILFYVGVAFFSFAMARFLRRIR
ncbi:MAG: MFS transporter [Alphaproteobacteria bacterium]|nr:MFS transporter [Alphaproteobacteria bacterium]